MSSNKPMKSMFIGVGCLFATVAGAAPPSKNDYASGITIQAAHTQPMIETVLPDEVYRVVTREDLGDLRVFNADGVPVPHAICETPESMRPQVAEQALQVFVLRGRDQVYTESARVNVETSSGTQVEVQESAAPTQQVVSGLIHIIDARGTEPLQAIRFDWRSPDDASEVKVRIEASDDLDQWQVVVPASTLLLARQDGQELRRERIEVPLMEYEYLRVQRIDDGPPLIVNSVMAEQLFEAEEIEPVWFTATRVASSLEEPEVLAFDAEHKAPVNFARVRLKHENSTAIVTLQSREDAQSSWRNQWSGESYVIVSDTVRRESPPARFQPTSDRYWRVQIAKDPQVHQDSSLELGYRPEKLRFLAQGPGPFTVAFGSRKAEVARPTVCDGLLADVSAADRERMIEQGYVGPVVTLGGAEALKAPPKKTSSKVVILWVVLVVGVGLLVAMAFSLLKRVRQPPPT